MMEHLAIKQRPSVYWQDKTDIHFTCSLTARQNELAQHKNVNKMYKEDRPSPIWPVKSSALQAIPSPRLEKLAQAKSMSREWMEDRPVYTMVSEAAKSASASPRTVELAKPKDRADRFLSSTTKRHQEEDNEEEVNELFNSKLVVTPTARTEALAVPKMEHQQYQHDLKVPWHVTSSALHTQASDRVCQLAKPKARKAFFEGFDPFRISPAAKHANASSRIIELCTPPAHRQHHKKV
ncbi:sperm microtubule associated protein 2 isoform X2 [Anomaloglossus baeobatrachus]|uniref:sperm microtubule associated protein 2 isoform X2 n=1 Tax=Anomaloglossus baeobatrachus TaxID=238106 RepID=UPI003F506511